MKQPWRLVVAVCGGLLASEVGAESRPGGSNGITFLHLRAAATGFELVESKTVTGSLRTRGYNAAKPGLHVEIRTADNRVLFRDVYAEPTVRRLEYEDPEHPGKIRVKEITNQEFTIRVPHLCRSPNRSLLPATGRSTESEQRTAPHPPGSGFSTLK